MRRGATALNDLPASGSSPCAAAVAVAPVPIAADELSRKAFGSERRDRDGRNDANPDEYVSVTGTVVEDTHDGADQQTGRSPRPGS